MREREMDLARRMQARLEAEEDARNLGKPAEAVGRFVLGVLGLGLLLTLSLVACWWAWA